MVNRKYLYGNHIFYPCLGIRYICINFVVVTILGMGVYNVKINSVVPCSNQPCCFFSACFIKHYNFVMILI